MAIPCESVAVVPTTVVSVAPAAIADDAAATARDAAGRIAGVATEKADATESSAKRPIREARMASTRYKHGGEIICVALRGLSFCMLRRSFLSAEV